MRKRFRLILAAAAAASLLLSGCGGSTSGDGSDAQTEQAGNAEGTESAGSTSSGTDTSGFLVVPLVADIQTADVHKTTKDYEIPLNIYDRLVDIEVKEDGSSEIVPSLAESWEISGDALTYTFHLRQGVKFHNGEELTADDVEYSFTRQLSVEGAVNTDFLAQIKGASQLLEGTADQLEGFETVDDYTFTITLSEPYAGFLACLSTPGCSIYNREATEAAGDQFGLDPSVTVGTGPFRLTDWTINDQLVLTRYEDYWKGPSELPGVVIRIVPDTETQRMMFESGELDVVDLDYLPDAVDDFTTRYPDQIVSGPRVGTTYFTMNQNIEPFQDVRVRKAVQMAIDRQAILDALYGGRGQVENGIYPHGLYGFNSSLPEITYDPEEAKALLAEAGYANGFEMQIAADSSASDATNQALEIIQAQLGEIGIQAEIQNMDESTWLATRNSGEMGSFMSTWTADYNDPDNFIYTFFGTPENTKLRSLNYSDTEVMERVQKARTIVDADERIAEYQALEEKIVTEDAAWVPMYSRTHSFAVSKRVQGFEVPWNGLSDCYFYGLSLSE
ncbi:MAG TPA: ABC transporter substrate-binding protein [Candidatus Caccovicinus merdipullorum]|uniref:ABC transporter substrate-binding protein n=1 Tax=Candidatus Caccovicinus merdipullorum TaxID=2840724 RepID=A0A9D1KGJ6_9FIRM|nr:ABC transporter substrate-binding protein [Candidatus Caccovicinus merdipullorum]